MRQRTFCFLLAATALCGIAVRVSEADSANNLVLIVNKTSAVLGLSTNDLKTIYLGEKEHWPNGQKVVPVALGTGRPELKAFLKQVCGMSEPDYKKYFIQANFTGKTLVLPRMAESPSAVKAMVSSTPGAIGFVRGTDVDGSVGVVRFNGAAPSDPGYQLSVGQ